MPWIARSESSIKYESGILIVHAKEIEQAIAQTYVNWAREFMVAQPEVVIFLEMCSNLTSQTNKELNSSGWQCEEHVASEIWSSDPDTEMEISFIQNRNHMFSQEGPIGQEVIVQVLFVQDDDIKEGDIIITDIRNNANKKTLWQRFKEWIG